MDRSRNLPEIAKHRGMHGRIGVNPELIKKPLIVQRFLAAQGGAAVFKVDKTLKMKESENHVFRFPCPDNSWMELIRVSFK